MRYQIKSLEGNCRINGKRYTTKGVVVWDDTLQWLFFLSKDPRLIRSHVCHGGRPWDLCPDESYWDIDNIACYNFGTRVFNQSCATLRYGGCSILRLFSWESRQEIQSFDSITQARLDEYLLPTSVIEGEPDFLEVYRRVTPNTDYDCAEPISAELLGGTAPLNGDGVAVAASPLPNVSAIKSTDYTDDIDYYGFHSYHEHHGNSTNLPRGEWSGYRVGVELEVECNNSECKRRLNNIHSNWFYQERDGSLGEYGVELITIPLLPKHAHDEAFWSPMTSVVKELAKSWDKPSTGLHVHIGREILGGSPEERSETLGKLLYFYHHIILDDPRAKRINTSIYGRDHTYHEMIGKTEEGNAVKLLGGSGLFKYASVKDTVKASMLNKSASERYFDINITNSNTVEFRKGKGSISPQRITDVVAWCELMCMYCYGTEWKDLSFDGFCKLVQHSDIASAHLKGYLG